MKKIFTILALAMGAITVSAEDFTDVLTVDVNGAVSEQKATISLDKDENGEYVFSLKNFVLQAGESSLGVGTIELSNVDTVAGDNGLLTLTTKQSVKIKEGDDSNVAYWFGPRLGDVPVELVAEKRGDKLYAVIDIDMMAMMQQIIKVTFGNGGYQIPNSGFENFHKYTVKMGGLFTAKNVDVYEATSWHSFATSTGSLASMANQTAAHPFTYKSDITRPGSAGSSSLMITSTSASGIIANGTVTTGRMNAGDMDPASTKNHAHLDMSVKDKDGNGDPFYAAMNGRPDSIAVWVKFKQSKAQADHPYATISAAITNGTYYQDPQEKDKVYNNVLAKAKNAKIESNGFAWQRISVPFEYVNDTVSGKAILVTISTNADAGKGTVNDTLYIDDAQLVYNASLVSAKVKDVVVNLEDGVNEYVINGLAGVTVDDVKIEVNGKGAKVEKTLTEDGKDVVVSVKITSNDLKTSKVYTFTMPDAVVTGIENAKADGNDKVKAVYDTLGRKVNATRHGETYIIVYESGKTEKVVR